MRLGVQALSLAISCVMADISARLRHAQSLLAAFKQTPGFAHIAASECEALSKEIEGAEMTTLQIAECMEEIIALGFERCQQRDLLGMLRAKLVSHRAPVAPPAASGLTTSPPAPPAASDRPTANAAQAMTLLTPGQGRTRQNYENLTMYLPASVRIRKQINPIARGLDCRAPRHRTVASDLAVVSPVEQGVNRFPYRGVGARAARGQRQVLQVPRKVGLDLSFGDDQAEPQSCDSCLDIFK